MEKKIILILMAVMILISNACENGFDEINTNKTALTTVDPLLLLNGAIVNSSYTNGSSGGGVLIFDMGIVQQIITPVVGVVIGANFNKENRLAGATLWQNYYPNVIRNTKEAIALAKVLPGRDNLLNMCRIVQAYAFMVLTDEYGDIPYFQGGEGYRKQIFKPVYDSQEVIYADLIKELEDASAALDPAGKIETSDVLFAGNIDQWKKFGYSLLLRAGMRLSKVNPTKAASTVQGAFAGGVITLNIDNVAIKHDNSFRNGHGTTLNSTEGGNFYLAEPFVNYLKNTNDPRLTAIAVRYTTAANSAHQASGNGATVLPADQVGLPIGGTELNYSKFSQADRKRVVKETTPVFLVTAAQTQLLLAEARHNNWITIGTEEDYYNSGVKLHMAQMASYDAASAVSSTDADNYLIANPFVSANALEQINTQYWIASFLNGPEAFANFRRSDYPVLVENPNAGDLLNGEKFIRRIPYPNSEISANSENVNLAIARMKEENDDKGGDDLSTRVWWDRP